MHVIGALIETAVILDVFASGLAEVEDLGGGNYRWTFYVLQKSIYDGGGTDRVVVSRIIMPMVAALAAIEQTVAAFIPSKNVPVKKTLDSAHH